MSKNPLQDPVFFSFLLQIDQCTAEEVRQKGCPACGGPLHWANYSRSPRGLPAGCDPDHSTRLSLCCGREGCRKRLTPASVRFLGRKVYVGAAVILYSAMCYGITSARDGQLQKLFGVSRQTLARWHKWWLKDFLGSRFWKCGRGSVILPLDQTKVPASLMERFVGTLSDKILAFLRFLSPITSASAPW